MHLLYLDDSGSAKNSNEEHIVLGGVSVFETSAFFITQELDKLAQSIDPVDPGTLEFHASEIFSRKKRPWSQMSKEEAQGVIKAVLQILANSNLSTKAFACAIHKNSFPEVDSLGLAFEDLCKRYDIYLSKMHADGDRQKGLLILDESSHETTLQKAAQNFRKLGTQWGAIRNLADIPFFVNSKASRIVQLADHIAYAVFRRYNSSDTQYFDIIASKFYSVDNIVHGLAHKHNGKIPCMCPACMSRRYSSHSF